MSDHNHRENTAGLTAGKLDEVFAIVSEAQAILRIRVHEIDSPALSGARDLVDLGSDAVLAVKLGGRSAELECLLEEARNRLYFAHAVLELVTKNIDDRALLGALRLVKEAEQRTDCLFESFSGVDRQAATSLSLVG